jgi:hypothetical protein
VDGGNSAAFDDFCDQLLAPGNGSTHAPIGGVKISQALVNYGQYMTEVNQSSTATEYNTDWVISMSVRSAHRRTMSTMWVAVPLCVDWD